MSQAQQAAAEHLVSRNWPDCLDRRVARPAVDIDPTVPQRRASDRRDDEDVIRPARDLRPMANVVALQAFKADARRFSGESITTLGDL